MDTREETRRLNFHLLIGRVALKKSRDNPLDVRMLHTQEEAHVFLAEKEKKQKEDVRWRQFSIEEALRRDLLSMYKEQTWMEQREKERMMRLPKYGPKTEQEAMQETKKKDYWKGLTAKPSQLQSHLEIAARNLMISLKPAVWCPI
jgi:hypothetical protein